MLRNARTKTICYVLETDGHDCKFTYPYISLVLLYLQHSYVVWSHLQNSYSPPVDDKVGPELIYNINRVTRGNDFRLSKNRSHYDYRKLLFTNRIVNIWNSLPNAVVDVDSADLLKSRLDNFWRFQDVKYDYTANLAGTGDRSEYDIESY